MPMAPSASAVSSSARPSPPPAALLRPRAASASASAGAGRARTEGRGKWWAPLLGWSGRAGYIEAAAPVTAAEEGETAARRRPTSSFVGGLTEEKARELRARMVEMESFHDAMYHSAIASRLARSA